MRSRSFRLAVLTVCALYFSLVYGLVYMPLIVPRLAAWSSIPAWLLVAIGVPFLVLAALFGSSSRQRDLMLGVVGIATGNAVAVGVAAKAGWPGFHETVAPFTETLPAVFVAVGAVALISGEVGHALGRMTGGSSQKPRASERS